MTERLTSSQIRFRLESDIARHPGCRDFHVGVSVRRVEHGRGPSGAWEADFHAIGDARGRAACRAALLEILDSARDDYTLTLDS
jgi:hypothetical protein